MALPTAWRTGVFSLSRSRSLPLSALLLPAFIFVVFLWHLMPCQASAGVLQRGHFISSSNLRKWVGGRNREPKEGEIEEGRGDHMGASGDCVAMPNPLRPLLVSSGLRLYLMGMSGRGRESCYTTFNIMHCYNNMLDGYTANYGRGLLYYQICYMYFCGSVPAR